MTVEHVEIHSETELFFYKGDLVGWIVEGQHPYDRFVISPHNKHKQFELLHDTSGDPAKLKELFEIFAVLEDGS